MQRHLRTTAWAIVAITVFTGVQKSSAGTLYSRKDQLLPLRLTQEDLSNILLKAKDILARANNQQMVDASPRITLNLSDGHIAVEAEGFVDLSGIQGIPDACYEVSFLYSLTDAPISRLRIDLDDARRLVQVEGVDPSQVDALFSLLLSEFEKHDTWFSGPLFRHMICIICYLALLVLITTLWVIRDRIWIYLAGVGAQVLFLVLMFTLPFYEWIPGAAVYSGEASIFRRHSADIGVVSSLLGMVSMVVASARVVVRSIQRKADGPEGTVEPPPDGGKDGAA